MIASRSHRDQEALDTLKGAAAEQDAPTVNGARHVGHDLAERRRRVPPLYRMSRSRASASRSPKIRPTATPATAPPNARRRGNLIGTVENRWRSDAERGSARPACRWETGRDRQTRHTRHRGPGPRTDIGERAPRPHDRHSKRAPVHQAPVGSTSARRRCDSSRARSSRAHRASRTTSTTCSCSAARAIGQRRAGTQAELIAKLKERGQLGA